MEKKTWEEPKVENLDVKDTEYSCGGKTPGKDSCH